MEIKHWRKICLRDIEIFQVVVFLRTVSDCTSAKWILRRFDDRSWFTRKMYAAAGNFRPVVYLRERQTCRSPPKAIAARIKRSRSRRCFIVYAVAEWAAVRGTVSVRSGESSGRALSRQEGEKRGALFGVDAPLFSSRRVASA